MDMNDDGVIDLSIEELAIHGFPRIERDPMERALREELVRLLSSDAGRGFETVRVEQAAPLELRLAQDSSSTALGHRLAQTIHGALRST